MRARPAHSSPSRTRLTTAAAVAMALAPAAAGAAIHTVTNTADFGPGSLRNAVSVANTNCGADPSPVIEFNIPTGPFVIQISDPLGFSCSSGTFNPTINGYSQPGAVANTLATGWNASTPIEVRKTTAFYYGGCAIEMHDFFGYGGALTVRGLTIAGFTNDAALCGRVSAFGNKITGNQTGILAGHSSIIGAAGAANRNVIGNNADYGIEISYGGAVQIVNNFIGTLDGAAAAPNFGGILGAGDPFGARTIQDNVISGNSNLGIALSLDGSTSITGNKIGVNAAGSAALANGTGGVQVSTAIGTTFTSNVISGNTGIGVALTSADTVTFSGNRIGLDGAAGTTAIPNTIGIRFTCGSGAVITGNFISGNSSHGLHLLGLSTSDITLNKVGAAMDGSALGNGANGILVESGTCAPPAGSDNHFGDNVIANNALNGILLSGGTGNFIDQSLIYDNGVKNINIGGGATPLPNDAGDADGGINNQQDHPVIDAVLHSGGNTTVNYTLDSVAAQSYLVQFFENSAAGTPAGEVFLGETTVGVGSFSITFPGLHDNIAATASRVTAPNDTSEFSPAVAVVLTPGVTVSPTSHNFGNVNVGTQSAAQSFTVTSSGTAAYSIRSLNSAPTCDGPPMCSTGDFLCSSDCSTSTSYNPGDFCTVTAKFAPNSAEAQANTIYICDNTSTSPQAISLSGTGVIPPATVSVVPTTLNFGNVTVGSTSAPQSSTLTSTGGSAYVIATFDSGPSCTGAPICSGGPFTCSTTCTTGTPYANGQSCTVTASFSPTAVGAASTSIYVCDNTSTSPQQITLLGNGTAIPPSQVSVSPSSVDFGDVQVGSSSAAQTITLTSTGATPYSISSFNSSPTCAGPSMCSGTDFNCSTTCTTSPTSYSTGQSCTVSATFSPTTVGSHSTTAYVCSNSSTSPDTIVLTGNATAIPPSGVSLSSSSMNFGPVALGSSGGPQSVTLTSTGATPYQITSFNSASTCDGPPMCTGTDFGCSTTCSTGTSYASGQSCTVSASFTPTSLGTKSAKIYVCDNTTTSPQLITLSGDGVAPPPPEITISPTSANFGRVFVGTVSAPRALQVTNGGHTPLTLGVMTTTGRFQIVGNECGSSLAARSSCLVSVAFAPSQGGSASGLLVVPVGTGLTATSIGASLSGTGVSVAPPPPPRAQLTLPTLINLGAYILGSAPIAQTIELLNTGKAALTFSEISISGPFTLVNNCPVNLAAGASCTLVIGFSSTTVGPAGGSLTVVSDAPGGSATIPVIASAQRAPVAVVRIDPLQMGFGDRLLGTTSPTQRATVLNDGGAPMALTGLVASDDFLVVATSCGTSLASRESCFADVAMRPTAFGPRSGELLINSNASGSPHRVTLTGRGCRPFVAIGNRSGPRENCAP